MASSDTLSLRLGSWLRQVGFTNGNPFATSEADREHRLLPEFFVDTGHYDLIWGDPDIPQTALIFAPRGGGKTAYRVMVQSQCCPADPRSDVLAVLHTYFEPILARVGTPEGVDAESHIRMILKGGVRALLDTLCRYQERAEDFPRHQRSRLAWFLRRFAPGEVGPIKVLTRLRSVRQEFDPSWDSFRQSVREVRLRELLACSDLLEDPVARFLGDVVDSIPEPLDPQSPPHRLLAGFVDLARSSELKTVYILMDRLDEAPETANDPEMIVNLLEPLLASLPIMETPGAAFKIFLPRLVFEPLRVCRTVRLDRLGVYGIEWEDRLLAEMLSRRLLAYSNGRIRSLAQICTSPLAEFIDQKMVEWADGSPRQMLRLGNLFFRVHVSRPGEISLLLTDEDWGKACTAFFREYTPLLRVDEEMPRVFVGKRRVALTALEHKFLFALHRRGGWCEKEELIGEVWGVGEGVTDQAVSRLVRRIREKIEPVPSNPIYLITEHGLGFRLENVAWPRLASNP